MKSLLNLLALAIMSVAFNLSRAQSVTAISPARGPVGTVVTITGTGFNTSSSSDLVFFGGVAASVSAASATSLTVTVPNGATPTAPVTVVNTGTNLQMSSAVPFNVTFNGASGSTISVATFSSTVAVTGSSNTNSGGTERKILDVADFDGDGKPDLVSVGNSLAAVLKNVTSGTITTSSFTVAATLTAPAAVYSLATGDINNDGKIDVVLGSGAKFSVFINTSTSGSISFAAAQNFTATGPFVKIADVDGDGRLDIISCGSSASTIYVFLNTTTGGSATATFGSAYSVTGTSSAKDFTIADMNNDRLPDLVTINASSLNIFLNTSSSGSPSFGTAINVTGGISGSSYNVMAVAAADLDGNGTTDLVCANNATPNSVIFANNFSSGTFSASNLTSSTITVGNTGTFSNNISIQDIDGDGKPDLVICNSNSGGSYVLQNQYTSGTLSGSSFGSAVSMLSGLSESSAVADLNGDHKPDLINAMYFSSTINIQSNAVVTLPVTLVSFTGTVTLAGNELKWVTSGEINSSTFTVERSSDGNTYSAIGTIAAAGNATADIAYNFVDAAPANGNNYYRLKLTDLDGASVYSAIVVMDNNITASFSAYPNPTTSTITIRSGHDMINASFILYNAQGQAVFSQGSISGYTYTLDLGNKASGMYFAEIKEAGAVVRLQFLKQ